MIREKTAIFKRVSTGEQNTENQDLQLSNLAAELNLEIVKIYDISASAYKNQHHPEINRIIRDSKRNGVKHLIIWDLSRLSRGGIEQTFSYLENFRKHGITVHSCNDDLSNELIIAVNAICNRFASNINSERTKAGLERAKRAGKTLGRPKGSTDKKQRSKIGYLYRWN